MGKFKPFLFGVLAGAGVIFVALQYHVVQTHEGFRVVPRTPQHSLGLAYADTRNYDARMWADRPELARALVANGSTDLVANSVANDLTTSIISDSPMEQLRSSLDRFSEPGKPDSDPLFDSSDFPDFPGIRRSDDSLSIPDTEDSLFPFPQAERKDRNNSVAEIPGSRTSIASNANDALENVFKPIERGNDDFRRSAPNPFTTAPSTPPAPENRLSIGRETEMLEQFLFDDEPTQKPETNTRTNEQSSSDFGMFQDVTGELESRANEALSRARQGFRNEVNRSIEDTQNSIGRYARGQVERSLPDSVSSLFPDNAPTGSLQPAATKKLPGAIEALKNRFDPFVE